MRAGAPKSLTIDLRTGVSRAGDQGLEDEVLGHKFFVVVAAIRVADSSQGAVCTVCLSPGDVNGVPWRSVAICRTGSAKIFFAPWRLGV